MIHNGIKEVHAITQTDPLFSEKSAAFMVFGTLVIPFNSPRCLFTAV